MILIYMIYFMYLVSDQLWLKQPLWNRIIAWSKNWWKISVLRVSFTIYSVLCMPPYIFLLYVLW